MCKQKNPQANQITIKVYKRNHPIFFQSLYNLFEPIQFNLYDLLRAPEGDLFIHCDYDKSRIITLTNPFLNI